MYNNYVFSVDPVSSFLRKNNSTKTIRFNGVKICNIRDPFEYEFKVRFGYLPKNTIFCSNGDIYYLNDPLKI